MRHSRWLWLSLALTVPGWAGSYRGPLAPQPPTIDGRLDDHAWQAALGGEGLLWEGALERRTAQWWITATPTHLYLALRSQLPQGGGLLAQVAVDSPKIVYDDSVEVWLDPTPGSAAGVTYQLLLNPHGRTAYLLHPRGSRAPDPAWRGDWPAASSFVAGAWEVEVAVPLAPLVGDRRADQGEWGINLCRNWKQPWAFSSLGGGGYAPTDRYRFGSAPAVAATLGGEPFLGQLAPALQVRNPLAAPLVAHASLRVLRDQMPELREERELQLAPGAAETLTLRADDASTQRFEARWEVLVAGQPVYQRTISWRRGQPWTWTVAASTAPPIDFRFAYYPSRNQLKAEVDLRNLPTGARAERVDLLLRPVGGAPLQTIPFAEFQDGRQTRTVSLPPLDGQYELAARATGTGVPAGEVVKPLARQRFVWEGQRLGTSRRVYAPFTPLRLTGQRLETVLRQYELGGGGLPAQIRAAGRPLLAAPITLRATADGAAQPSRAPLSVVRRVDDQEATSTAQWLSGPLRLTANGRWDYDGTLRYDLTWQVAAGHRLDRLDLEIPLVETAATHLHAIGDGIRNTLYRAVPTGSGVVWDASKVGVNDFPRGFCSYLYLGTAVRGLSWFTANDRGWAWDERTPNLEVSREQVNGQRAVVLRVHLVNQPVSDTAPRTLTCGLLAAPVKPRLGDWRHQWRRGQWTLLGTDINWFALGDCGSVYPAHGDLTLWEALKKANTTAPTPAEVEAVYERGRPYFEPYGAAKLASWRAHVNYNLRSRRGKQMVFYYNRASFQAAPEFQTFQDEWALTDWRLVGPGNGIGEIKIVPSDSYIDHALYWYGQSFDHGANRGVYWDNWFFVGSLNTAQTAAYPRPDGSVRPDNGLWQLRELAKRTFQYLNERGMPPITMPHMTSTNILPLHSFATVQYDWEWKYSEGDVQDRFSRDYLLLVSNGDLAGTWPVLLGDHGKLAEDPWTQRTFAGCALVHDLDGGGLPAVWDPLLQPIDAVLSQPGHQVYRYWDERPQPVRAAHPDLPCIVYVLPGREAVVLVTSYADRDLESRLACNPAALGLPPAVIVTDLETGQRLAGDAATVPLAIKRHDLRLLRVSAGTSR